MRATFILMFLCLVLGSFLWVTFSGAPFIVAGLVYCLILVITVGYPDAMILFFLGAREVRSSDEARFFEAAAQESYKLSVPMPHLYFYNGSLERAFVLQKSHTISLVISKSMLAKCSPSDLSAICFELLLQVKKGMAPKRTKIMFLLGSTSWVLHSVMGLLSKVIRIKEFREAIEWTTNYLLHPWLEFVFRLTLGEGYFKKLQNALAEFPHEKAQLDNVGLKLTKPIALYSLPSKRLMELSHLGRSKHYHNIMSLEFLPHEWDYLFSLQEITRAR